MYPGCLDYIPIIDGFGFIQRKYYKYLNVNKLRNVDIWTHICEDTASMGDTLTKKTS